MTTILTVIGARPQIIKAAALNREIKNNFNDQIKEVILHTGQHYDEAMSAFFFDELGISKPDINLHVGSLSHAEQTAAMMLGIEKAIDDIQPDYVLVYGDTNSTLAAALVAAKKHIDLIHVEAGLRSFDKKMPEEINRITTDHCSTLLFSPTKTGVENLRNEGFSLEQNLSPSINAPAVYHVGDVMYDNTLFYSKMSIEKSTIIADYSLGNQKYILATVHRDSNTDEVSNLNEIVEAFDEITSALSLKIIWPMHPRTKKMLGEKAFEEVRLLIENNPQIVITPPVSFFDIIQLEKNADLIITDSGGVQKEAYFFQKPGIILRPHTEWVELVDSGHAILCGANRSKIVAGVQAMLNKDFSDFPEIFGNGHAANQICNIIVNGSSC